MEKSAFEKMMLRKNRINRNYEDQKKWRNSFLVTINIHGSTGSVRFVVNKKDPVSGVIGTALKSYAREGRLPSLGLMSATASFTISESVGAHRILWGEKFRAVQKACPSKLELISQKMVAGKNG